MKRFTVIVAMLALMLSAAVANASVFTDPNSGAEVLTNWAMRGYAVQAANVTRDWNLSNASAAIGTVTFTKKTGENYNMTATGYSYGQFGTHEEGGIVPFSATNFNAQLNTTVTKNNTFSLTGNGFQNGFTATGLTNRFKMQKTADGQMFFAAGSKKFANTTIHNNNTAALIALAQTEDVTKNRLIGTWKIFGWVSGLNMTSAVGNNTARYGQFIMGDMIVNSSKSQFGNATIFYKTASGRDAFGTGYTVDRVTTSISGGALTTASGDYNYFTSAVLDKTGNTLISVGNTTAALGLGASATSTNATCMFIAIRAASDGSAGFSTLKTKKYGVLAAGMYTQNNGSVGLNTRDATGAAAYGTLDLASQYTIAAATSNLTAFNASYGLVGTTGPGNSSIEYGSFGIKDKPMAAMNFAASRAASPLNGANFTGAMRVDGNLYVGIITNGAYRLLTVIIPETSDAVIDRSSLSSDFVTDAQLLAATGLNLCPRANASQTGTCFELSHDNYPTTGVNARQLNDITVSTYVQSVVDAADNASIMSTALLNTTARADSADHPGNFTSEEYTGAPSELKSMYAFNGTSFKLGNASNNVRLLAKWVFVANGSGNGKIAGLTAEQADPWKYMKKYQDIKNATAYTKVYGNGTLQNWSKFWDADGNAATLADGTVFYTQYGTNASLLAPLQKTDTFTSGTTYVLWAVLANGGKFDLDNSTDFVFDPPRIVTDEEIVISSSSSSGCVFNPVAGFGLEWLLLLLAPAVGIIRSRFRK